MKQYYILILMMLLPFSVWADPVLKAKPEVLTEALPKALVQGLNRLAELKGFSCAFEQTVFYGDGSKQQYHGTLAVAKQGHFRWQYTKPYEQLYISNGDGIWLYEPDLMQVQWLQSISAVDPVAMRLLEGRVKPDEVQLIDEVAGVYHVRIGKADRPTELWLALDNQQKLPIWFESRDSLDNRNRMRLLSIHERMPDQKLFEFEIPEGVDVIDANGNIMESQQ